ncbi:GspE/PulE family protein [Candidatus Dependentiae bacterium]
MGEGNNKKDLSYILLSQEDKIKQRVSQEPIIELVDLVLYNAIQIGASDIHFEPDSDKMRLRYRIDGVLHNQKKINLNQSDFVLSRLKILSFLDIAQKRIPQDGKFRVSVKNDNNSRKIIDLRVSTFPTIYGEKMVIRILDQSKNLVKLKSLGLSDDNLETLSSIVKRQQGFFLVTGPTGSGKTTTLYAILSMLNKTEKNIVTMEDPVEYNLDGIIQSHINPKAGFTFEKGLRSILRQDPDIIMVGEIRDKQTAKTAIEAALTGHLVFSTLHTNDSASAITRLLDMGVEPFLITASLSGVLAQRLVRKLCNKCKKERLVDSFEYKKIKDYNLQKLFSAVGCKYCFNLGYKGRTGIFELLVVDDIIRNLILSGISAEEICLKAKEGGLKTLEDDGILKLKNGVIGLEEILTTMKF